MLSLIPTHIVAGPLGAGKTTLLKQLLQHARPPGESWAILVNEFGQVGIDAALLQGANSGVSVAEVPGGCLCCVNGVPFQVGLGRLLRRAKPDRLFIETSGLGHPLELLSQLGKASWQGVLALQPLIMVLDAQALCEGRALPSSQVAAIDHAGLLLMNKSAAMGEDQRQAAGAGLPSESTLTWCNADEVVWEQIPKVQAATSPAQPWPSLPEQAKPPGRLWQTRDDLLCQQNSQDGWHSIGWQAHPELLFDIGRLESWLRSGQWRRAKGVVNTPAGWRSFNAVEMGEIRWQHHNWAADNRLELLSDREPQRGTLESGLRSAIAKD